MVHVPVGAMSGGEKVKVELARLMMAGSDLLLLDEPSNHMDIESCSALGEVLRAWPGTLLMSTHDRALIDAVSDRIIIWQGTRLLTYEGNYTDYQSSNNGQHDIAALVEGMKRAQEASKYKSGMFTQGITGPDK
jgi:ATP-binding cassette subfamily F protein 3